MTLASLLDPSLCPLTPMHITVDEAGNTRETPGAPNAQVCLHSDAVQAHAELYMGLVETGVGVVPAGGGTKEMVLRAVDSAAAILSASGRDAAATLAFCAQLGREPEPARVMVPRSTPHQGDHREPCPQ